MKAIDILKLLREVKREEKRILRQEQIKRAILALAERERQRTQIAEVLSALISDTMLLKEAQENKKTMQNLDKARKLLARLKE